MPAELQFRSSLVPEDMDALAAMQKAGDPRAAVIRQKMTPDEVNAYIQHLSGPADTNALETGLAAAGAGGAAITEFPTLASVGKAAWPYAKYAAGATAIGYLPIPASAKTALEMMLGLKAMKGGIPALGNSEAAAEAAAAANGVMRRAPASPSLDPRTMGHMSDEEVIAAYKGAQLPKNVRQPAPEPAQTTPRVSLRSPASPVMPPADIEQRTRPDWLTQDVAPGPFADPKSHLLRPDESHIGLIREKYPQLNVSQLKVPPVPDGADPLSKAIRQRKHIGDAQNRYSMPHGVTPETPAIRKEVETTVRRRTPK